MTRERSGVRLDLIVEALRYVKHVKGLGMSSSAYDKALREPIHFYWERTWGPTKRKCVNYVSDELAAAPAGAKSTYEHTVPFAVLRDKLLELDPITEDAVEAVLHAWCVTSALTKEEGKRLSSVNSTMPPDWDGQDVLARYREPGVDIKVHPNPDRYC